MAHGCAQKANCLSFTIANSSRAFMPDWMSVAKMDTQTSLPGKYLRIKSVVGPLAKARDASCGVSVGAAWRIGAGLGAVCAALTTIEWWSGKFFRAAGAKHRCVR